ncbi:MAG: cell division protein ZapA [Peptostreptococcaceae bacterium]|nr:cell division protein ZapA [Peptostreptococcaceae bacterium]MDY5739119.1 cell division protein ZapA [Anaerovoracaceae bacterium]SFE49546.1 Cell division protein ZapA, inhibits GTPase activity of FtsZ [Peptostreptococcaceae bacterium pGA-8]
MEINKVKVKIYGQEFTVAGEKTEEEIFEIAQYVDEKMHVVSRASGDSSTGSVALLTSMVIAEEYFDSKNRINEAEKAKAQMENDAKYYLKMWEDSKRSFAQYKESLLELKSKQKADDKLVKQLEEKCSEYESSCFDLQMENIKLKSALEKLQR